MALATVSQKVLDALYARLSSVTTGFNAGILAQAPVYSIPTDFMHIDWANTSRNFAFAQVNPDLLEQSGVFKYPFSCLYVLESGQTGEQKFTQFSGMVRCVFEVYLSWKSMTGKQNHEAYANCVEDVVYDVVNRLENQNWGKPLVYNGMIQCKRGPLVFAAENWRQRVGFSIMFGLHQ